MSGTTEPIPADVLRRWADTMRPMPVQPAGLPAIVPAARPVGWIPYVESWVRLGVSLGISLLGHVGVLAWLGYLPTSAATGWIPVQSGSASIELQATLASDGTEEQGDLIEAAMRPVIKTVQDAPVEPQEQETALRAASMPPVVRAAASSDLPPIRPAAVGDAEPADWGEMHLAMQRQVDLPCPPGATAENGEAASPPVRTDVGHRRLEQWTARAALASLPSPASAASQGADSSTPAPVYNPAPPYPPDALAARQTGRVVLWVQIGPDGTVLAAGVRRSSGVGSLDEAALEAVRRWRFAPAGTASAPPRSVAVPIRFVIAPDDYQRK